MADETNQEEVTDEESEATDEESEATDEESEATDEESEATDEESEAADEPREETPLPQTAEETLEASKAMLAGLFERMKLDITADGRVDDDTIHVDLDGADAELLLGRGHASPKSLEAIQTLVRASVVDGRKFTFVLDVGGFRQKRQERLERVAHEFARAAERIGKPMVVAGLNSFERRVVHQELEDDRAVKTDSEGQGSFRKLRVEPTS